MNTNEATMPNDAVIELLAKAVAAKISDALLEDHLDLVQECVMDAIDEVLGTTAYTDEDDTRMHLAMELSGRIAVIAV